MGARLVPVTVTSPAIWGLNLQASGDALDLRWATKADNLVINALGKLTGRQGFNDLVAAGLTGVILGLFEYIATGNQKYLIISTDTGVFIRDSSGGLIEISNTLGLGRYNWVNFNGRLVGHLKGQAGIVTLSSPSSVLSLSSVGEITGDAVGLLSAWGKLWVIDKQGVGNSEVIKVSDLLDETTWTEEFILDLNWGGGRDTGKALSEHDGNLIIYGEDSLIVFSGNPDVNLMEKIESVRGIGCIAPRTIQQIGDDTVFLSKVGLRGLARTLRDGKMEVGDLASPVRGFLTDIVAGNTDAIVGTFLPKEGYYLISTPTTGEVLCFHTNVPTPQQSFAVTRWLAPADAMVLLDGELISSNGSELLKYTGEADNGSSFLLDLLLPWWGIDNEEQQGISQRVKIPKRATLTIDGVPEDNGGGSVILCYSFNWKSDLTCVGKDVQISGEGGAEYNEAEYGVAEFVSTSGKFNYRFPMSRRGSVIQVGIQIRQLSEIITIHELNLQVKVGQLTYG